MVRQTALVGVYVLAGLWNGLRIVLMLACALILIPVSVVGAGAARLMLLVVDALAPSSDEPRPARQPADCRCDRCVEAARTPRYGEPFLMVFEGDWGRVRGQR